MDWTLTDILHRPADDPVWQRADIVQPALFSIMVSLAALWRSYGIEPDAVLGHSQGEIAAAHVCGALTLHDAAKVIALRSQALQAYGAPGHGLRTPARGPGHRGSAHPLARPAMGGRRQLPTATVISGNTDALDEALDHYHAHDVRAKRIPVDYASHCPHMDAVAERLPNLLDGIAPRAADIPFYSTVDGRWAEPSELDAAYWYRNLRSPVRFAHAVHALTETDHHTYIEVSPHPHSSRHHGHHRNHRPHHHRHRLAPSRPRRHPPHPRQPRPGPHQRPHHRLATPLPDPAPHPHAIDLPTYPSNITTTGSTTPPRTRRWVRTSPRPASGRRSRARTPTPSPRSSMSSRALAGRAATGPVRLARSPSRSGHHRHLVLSRHLEAGRPHRRRPRPSGRWLVAISAGLTDHPMSVAS
ncbi:acyltransferase domain-containing protein [Streptomyces sp. FXJ1.4098]|nr:acyltransferase domain-containing protein [Streptomyces sp. FXJ1.4098]